MPRLAVAPGRRAGATSRAALIGAIRISRADGPLASPADLYWSSLPGVDDAERKRVSDLSSTRNGSRS